jgi:hypothetical protein
MEWQRHFERHATPQMGRNCGFWVQLSQHRTMLPPSTRNYGLRCMEPISHRGAPLLAPAIINGGAGCPLTPFANMRPLPIESP